MIDGNHESAKRETILYRLFTLTSWYALTGLESSPKFSVAVKRLLRFFV